MFPKAYYLTCFWPGLPELWFRGRISALPMAVSFGFALNVVLVLRYLRTETIPGPLVSMAFWVGIVLWTLCTLKAMRLLPNLLAPRDVSPEPDPFPDAHAAYLAGDYATAETLLKNVLAIEPRDPPALLLLVAVLRHDGRTDAAAAVLQEIRRTEAADGWFVEIDAEQKRLLRDQHLDDPADEQSADEQSADEQTGDERFSDEQSGDDEASQTGPPPQSVRAA